MSSRKLLQFAYHLLTETEDSLVLKLKTELDAGASDEVIVLIRQQLANCQYKIEKVRKKLDVKGSGLIE